MTAATAATRRRRRRKDKAPLSRRTNGGLACNESLPHKKFCYLIFSFLRVLPSLLCEGMLCIIEGEGAERPLGFVSLVAFFGTEGRRGGAEGFRICAALFPSPGLPRRELPSRSFSLYRWKYRDFIGDFQKKALKAMGPMASRTKSCYSCVFSLSAMRLRSGAGKEPTRQKEDHPCRPRAKTKKKSSRQTPPRRRRCRLLCFI